MKRQAGPVGMLHAMVGDTPAAELQAFGEQSPEVQFRAILAEIERLHGRVSAPALREFAKTQRAIAEAAEREADRLQAKALAHLTAIADNPLSVASYLERAKDKT